jgi:uncharacterized protein (DUF488 family)
MNSDKETIYTIGYAPYTIETFIKVLIKYQISALVDVRSSPYSQFNPEFNRESLKDHLSGRRISYVFLGDCCGARVKDPSCYLNGKVDYKLVAEYSKFKEGLERIKKGMIKHRLALMCAETDPITCHRTILICRNLLLSERITIKHILSNGRIEDHTDSELRLMKLFKLDQPEFFRTDQQRLDDAYSLQGENIAYKIAESSNETWE